MRLPVWICALALLTLGAPGFAAGQAADDPTRSLRLLQSTVALGTGPDGVPVPVRTFYAHEAVRLYTKLSVDPAGRAETYRLVYKWYTGEAVTLSFGATKRVDTSQVQWWAYVDTSHFAPGHHRAELYVDDRLFATADFDTKAWARPRRPAEDTALKEAALTLLLKGDMPDFDALATRYRSSQGRTASGTWKLSLLYSAVELASFGPRDPHWLALQRMSDAWLEEHPNSATAVALNARLLYEWAWAWRGDGYAPYVATQNWSAYRDLIERSRRVLDQHPWVASQDPEWYELRISIARQQGATSEQILALARRALDRAPYYYPIHYATVNALLPRWGGSRRDIEAYVQMALAHSRAKEGTQAYARIYYYIARRTERNPVNDLNVLGAKWPPMRESLAELLQAYPSSFNRDVARSMTCFAGDAQAYRALGRAPTGYFLPVAWWDSADWRRGCNGWAFEGLQMHDSVMHRIEAYLSFLWGFGPEFWTRLEWIMVVLFLLTEGGFRLWAGLARRQAATPAASLFDAAEMGAVAYPRHYRLVPRLHSWSGLAIRIGVYCAAAAYMLTTIPWPNPTETGTIVAALCAIAAVGGLMLFNMFTSKLVLSADAICLQGLFGNRELRRDEIDGIRALPARNGLNSILIIPRNTEMRALVVPPVMREDKVFRQWFSSFPAVSAGVRLGSRRTSLL